MSGRPPVPAWEREFNRRLGRNIAAARQAQALSGRELARRAGVSQTQVCCWEHGGRGIGVARLQLVADALGVTATSLIPPLADLPLPEGDG